MHVYKVGDVYCKYHRDFVLICIVNITATLYWYVFEKPKPLYILFALPCFAISTTWLLWRDSIRETVPYRTVPYRTVPYRTVPYRTVPYRTVPYRTVPYRTVPYRTVPYRTVPYRTYRTVPYDTIRYDTIRYDTIRYDTIRYDTIRYDTIRYDTIRYDTIRWRIQLPQHLNSEGTCNVLMIVSRITYLDMS